jgi:UDP-N-acetylmuramate dehydrogenase
MFLSLQSFGSGKLELKTFDLEQCRFGYRDSILNRKEKEICDSGSYFKLTSQNHHIKTEYGAIKSELENLELKILLFRTFPKR